MDVSKDVANGHGEEGTEPSVVEATSSSRESRKRSRSPTGDDDQHKSSKSSRHDSSSSGRTSSSSSSTGSISSSSTGVSNDKETEDERAERKAHEYKKCICYGEEKGLYCPYRLRRDAQKKKEKERDKDREKNRDDKNKETEDERTERKAHEYKKCICYGEEKGLDCPYRLRRDAEKKVRREKEKEAELEKERARRERDLEREKEQQERRERAEQMAKDRDERARKRKAEEAKQLEDRDEYTIIVSQIHPKIDERDLFQFFSLVGYVVDIRLLRDTKTNKSRGISYVEFKEKDSVTKALALGGQLLGGYPITVQPSLTEKAKADRTQREMAALFKDQAKLIVKNLHPNLEKGDLLPMFEEFGAVESFKIIHATAAEEGAENADPDLLTSTAEILYAKRDDSELALSLNGWDLGGRKISVTRAVSVLPTLPAGASAPTATMAMVMGMPVVVSGAPTMPLLPFSSSSSTAPPVLAGAAMPVLDYSVALVIRNIFAPDKQENEGWPGDLEEEVASEIAKENLGMLVHIHVDRNSPLGLVYLKLNDLIAAAKAHALFNGRWFNRRQLSVDFMNVNAYDALFPKAA